MEGPTCRQTHFRPTRQRERQIFVNNLDINMRYIVRMRLGGRGCVRSRGVEGIAEWCRGEGARSIRMPLPVQVQHTFSNSTSNYWSLLSSSLQLVADRTGTFRRLQLDRGCTYSEELAAASREDRLTRLRQRRATSTWQRDRTYTTISPVVYAQGEGPTEDGARPGMCKQHG